MTKASATKDFSSSTRTTTKTTVSTISRPLSAGVWGSAVLAAGSAPLAGWNRLPAAQQWLDKNNLQPVARDRFDAFLQHNPTAAAKIQSDADKEARFKQFQAWEAERNARAQAAQA